MMNRVGIFVLAAALAVAGCKGELDSQDPSVESSRSLEWRLLLLVETLLDLDGEEKTTVSAALLEIGGPFEIPIELRLNAGDSVQASDGVQTIDLAVSEDNKTSYEGTFPMPVTGQQLMISLMKGAMPVDVDWWVPTNDSPQPDFSEFFFNATDIQVDLTEPEPVTITAPTYVPPNPPEADNAVLQEYELGESVTLEWGPTNSETALRLISISECVNIFDRTKTIKAFPGVITIIADPDHPNSPDDPGKLTIEKVDNFLGGQPIEATEDPAGCIITLTLEREAEVDNVTLDPALSDENTVVTRYGHSIQIKSVPATSDD